ncbi:MAG TPA: putative quinol monooxygenase [Galbitalea sp.]
MSLYAEFTALDGAADRVEELLRGLAKAVRQEVGNLVFDAFRKTDDPSTFFVYEVYADDDAFERHLGGEHGRIFNAELATLVRGGKSTLTRLQTIASEP